MAGELKTGKECEEKKVKVKGLDWTGRRRQKRRTVVGVDGDGLRTRSQTQHRQRARD